MVMLLCMWGKDLCVVVFLVYFMLCVDGLDISLYVFGLLCVLLECFGVWVYFCKLVVWCSVLEWFCNECFIDLLSL